MRRISTFIVVAIAAAGIASVISAIRSNTDDAIEVAAASSAGVPDARQPDADQLRPIEAKAVADLMVGADPVQAKILADGFVSEDEYASSIDAAISCIRSLDAGVTVSGPKRSKDGTTLSWGYGFRGELEKGASAEDLQKGATECQRVNLSVVDRVYRAQLAPTDQEREGLFAAYAECVAEKDPTRTSDSVINVVRAVYQVQLTGEAPRLDVKSDLMPAFDADCADLNSRMLLSATP